MTEETLEFFETYRELQKKVLMNEFMYKCRIEGIKDCLVDTNTKIVHLTLGVNSGMYESFKVWERI